MTIQEKIYSSLAGLAALAIVAVLVIVGIYHTPQPANTSTQVGGGFVHGFCDTNGNSGTTTPLTYQYSAAATTTLPCFTDSADQIDVQLYMVASTSGSAATMQIQYSNDNVTWYGQETPTAVPVVGTGYVALATTTDTYYFTPGTTATSTMDLKIPAVNSKYTRVLFRQAGAGYGFYAAIINKNVIRN